MWVGHFAPAIALRPFVNVPMWVLALAANLADATAFVNALLGIEGFNYDGKIASRRNACFPYSNEAPFSHSLLGMVVLGVAFAGVYSAFIAKRGASAKDLSAILFATVSHFFLDLAVHRPDMVLTPSSDTPHGTSLFDHSTLIFFLEVGVLGAASIPYLSRTMPKIGRNTTPVKIIAAVLVAAQAQFCFTDAPTSESRWVHAPLFLTTLLALTKGIDWMDKTRRIA